ncbi:hypothetical protein ACJ73_01954 [Blastomyces percursus]|uniref:GPI inositol-deacylase winged helix domain-containing protein n=1 Tax=Blastomyces percursus TaxID=1658174 RepID=A0A1J9RDJ1_9EURO|nr:hypothetical protein ACJ73_01954 [Blastomyces percursus]
MIRQAGEVWIVLDTLDECPTRITQGLFSWMMRNLPNSDQINVHPFVSDKSSGKDIESEISERPEYKNRVSIHECIIDVQDIIETRLTEKADGMFRWAACQLDALENCLDYDELSKALAFLPDTLDATYARILNAIPDIRKPKVIRILHFLAFAERLLQIVELVDVIVVDFERNPMPKPLEISRYCSSLVSTNSVNGRGEHAYLQLAHFSVKEYLTSDRVDKSFRESFAEINARGIITAYLSQMIMIYAIQRT